jgi:hypothetical protein
MGKKIARIALSLLMLGWFVSLAYAAVKNWNDGNYTGSYLDTKPTGTVGNRFFETDGQRRVWVRTAGSWSLVSTAQTTTCANGQLFYAFDSLSGNFTCTAGGTSSSSTPTTMVTNTGTASTAGNFAVFTNTSGTAIADGGSSPSSFAPASHVSSDSAVHGVGTSTVASYASVTGAISAHASSSSAIHGVGTSSIASYASVTGAVSDHSGLSSAIHGVGTSTVASYASVTGAISTHAALTQSVHGFDASGYAPADPAVYARLQDLVPKGWITSGTNWGTANYALQAKALDSNHCVNCHGLRTWKADYAAIGTVGGAGVCWNTTVEQLMTMTTIPGTFNGTNRIVIWREKFGAWMTTGGSLNLKVRVGTIGQVSLAGNTGPFFGVTVTARSLQSASFECTFYMPSAGGAGTATYSCIGLGAANGGAWGTVAVFDMAQGLKFESTCTWSTLLDNVMKRDAVIQIGGY